MRLDRLTDDASPLFHISEYYYSMLSDIVYECVTKNGKVMKPSNSPSGYRKDHKVELINGSD